MDTVVPILVILAVFAAFGAGLILLHRWGDRHDPLGGKSTNTWSTTGERKRVDSSED